MIVDEQDLTLVTLPDLERLHWKCFGIWMGMRSKARQGRTTWGKVHAYTRDVLDPMMYRIEQLKEEEE
tara:strand:+ start:9761 stop:9964 length:204 start_codon:yes stop_codon:yes gene_type:complete